MKKETETSSEEEKTEESSEQPQSENETSENETQEDEQKTGQSEDYLSTSEKPENKEDETDWQKRYSDSSREAMNLKKELDQKQKEIEDWDKWLQTNTDIAETIKQRADNPYKTSTSPESSELSKRVQGLEEMIKYQNITQNNRIIQNFERSQIGTTFIPDLRAQMRPYTKALVDGGIPLEEALSISFEKVIGKKANQIDKNSLIQRKVNEDATTTTSNSLLTKNNSSIQVTDEESRVMNRMKFKNDKEKTAFLEKLREVREQK